jgi:hypothetical protein
VASTVSTRKFHFSFPVAAAVSAANPVCFRFGGSANGARRRKVEKIAAGPIRCRNFQGMAKNPEPVGIFVDRVRQLSGVSAISSIATSYFESTEIDFGSPPIHKSSKFRVCSLEERISGSLASAACKGPRGGRLRASAGGRYGLKTSASAEWKSTSSSSPRPGT